MSRGQVIYIDILNSWYQVRTSSVFPFFMCSCSCISIPVFLFQLLQMLGTFSPYIANFIQPSENMMTNTSSSLSLLSSLLVLVKFDQLYVCGREGGGREGRREGGREDITVVSEGEKIVFCVVF